MVSLTMIIYTVVQNNMEVTIRRENRKQDLKIADERRGQDIISIHSENYWKKMVNQRMKRTLLI